MSLLKWKLAIAIVVCTFWSASAQEFPIVFDDKNLLKELGVTIRDIGPQQDVSEFGDKCYYYGDGGYTLTLSPGFISSYSPKGFSVGSLCMGMLSGIRFHPTTGARLVTFVVADVEAVRLYGADPFAISSEVTLEVPTCFAAGKPLSDCDWKFAPMSGARLDKQTLKSLAGLAGKAAEAGQAAVASGVYDTVCAAEEAFGGACRIDVYPMSEDTQYIVGLRARELGVAADWPVSFFDISPEFPEGFGYALFADGAAGPSAQMGAAKIALDPKKRASMALIESLKIKLK